jgi:hypothetical protein
MPAPAKAKKAPVVAISLEELIRRRAYELYVERGNQSGSELDDWLQAEEEVLESEQLLPRDEFDRPSGIKAELRCC